MGGDTEGPVIAPTWKPEGIVDDCPGAGPGANCGRGAKPPVIAQGPLALADPRGGVGIAAGVLVPVPVQRLGTKLGLAVGRITRPGTGNLVRFDWASSLTRQPGIGAAWIVLDALVSAWCAMRLDASPPSE